jgi:hypothetical protein
MDWVKIAVGAYLVWIFLGLTLLIDAGWRDARSEIALLDRAVRGLHRRVGRFRRPLGAIGTSLEVNLRMRDRNRARCRHPSWVRLDRARPVAAARIVLCAWVQIKNVPVVAIGGPASSTASRASLSASLRRLEELQLTVFVRVFKTARIEDSRAHD